MGERKKKEKRDQYNKANYDGFLGGEGVGREHKTKKMKN